MKLRIPPEVKNKSSFNFRAFPPAALWCLYLEAWAQALQDISGGAIDDCGAALAGEALSTPKAGVRHLG
jgi:hypothetical protein